MKTAIIIPARWQSSRFPGKPLNAIILGKPLLWWVWQQCIKTGLSTYVATDHQDIANFCRREFGPTSCVMTSSRSLTGTDRVAEANKKIKAEIVAIVQGDEPLVEPNDIMKMVLKATINPQVVYNAMCKIEDISQVNSKNVPKVVATRDGHLLYMSRAAIPAVKGDGVPGFYMKQTCIYVMSAKHLEIFKTPRAKTPLEAIEDIEILRFLELGETVQMIKVKNETIAVDVPEDVKRVEAEMTRRMEKGRPVGNGYGNSARSDEEGEEG